MAKREFLISHKLSNLDLNRVDDKISLYTYWCRVAYSEFEKWNPKEHAHSFWELHLCLSGDARMVVDGVEYILTANTYLFLRPKSKHQILFESDNYSEFVWGFSIENSQNINSIIYDKHQNIGVMNAAPEMLNSVFSILDNTEKAEFGYYSLIKDELHHIFLLLARNVGVQNKGVYNKASHNELNLIRKYICENISSDISIDDIASEFCISKGSIERMCKKEYKMTFSQMKRELKADAIRSFLQNTDYSMEEIAEATGFSDRYSLGKFFKKFEGSTPVEYRKGIRK